MQWGDTVNFANSDDAPHGITIPRIAFASPSIPAGQSWEQVFNGQSGNYLFRQVEGRPFLGMVVVQLGGKVTMTVKPTAVVYGKRVTFEGTTQPGYQVALEQQVMGQASQWAGVLTVAADGDGKWSTSLAPKLGARYRATAAVGQLRSTAVLVDDVQPSVVLTAPRGARKDKQVAVRARIVPAGAANTADLELVRPSTPPLAARAACRRRPLRQSHVPLESRQGAVSTPRAAPSLRAQDPGSRPRRASPSRSTSRRRGGAEQAPAAHAGGYVEAEQLQDGRRHVE